ncbi:MAG: hypothetical protein IPM54_25405 [Polyangiaceae bacterium]|nr:hypothetical protein [Polyangiaceae bacterium]
MRAEVIQQADEIHIETHGPSFRDAMLDEASQACARVLCGVGDGAK